METKKYIVDFTNVKYYLENGTLQVPKRALEDVLISVQ